MTRPRTELQAIAKDCRRRMGERIQEARRGLKLTLAKVATAAGFGDNPANRCIWLIEHGRMAIPPDKIEALEQVLGFRPATLFWAEIRCRELELGFDVEPVLPAFTEADPLPVAQPQLATPHP